MNALIDAAISRRRTTLAILFMLVFAGIAAYRSIPIATEPSIQVPFFVISVVNEGVSPEDAERLLIMPIERELRSLEGLDEMRSYAKENVATVVVEFHPETDLGQAELDVREAVDRAKAELPSTAEEPVVNEETTDDFPIIHVNLTGPVPERVLYNLALRLKHRLEGINSVLKIQLRGDREEVLEAVLDPSLLDAYALSVEEVLNSVVQNNRLIPAGSIDGESGRFSIKVPSVIEEANDLLDLPIKSDGTSVITLRQVADIRRTFKDRSNYARVNGNPAISLGVVKRANGNVVDTSNTVKELIEAERANFPALIDVFYTQDQAPMAERQVSELQGNILTALVLVMILVVAALGLRSGMLVGVGIPISFLFGLIIINYLGMTFNFMVMDGLLIGLGMLIDGAIVITEYADRKMSEGMHREAAYRTAAKRMCWPVIASVATTLAAFLPLLFWPGITGKFMSFLPITVFTVLIGSLLFALIFLPTLGAMFGKAPSKKPADIEAMRVLEHGDPTRLNTITGWYARLLKLSTRYAAVTTILTISSLIGAFMLYGQFGKGVIFFSDTAPQFASVQVRGQGNLSASEVRDLVLEVEELVLQVPGIQSANTATFLPGTVRGGWGDLPGDTIGRIFLELYEQQYREKDGFEILEELRARTAHLAGIELEVTKMEMGPNTGKAVQIQFAAQDADLLQPIVERVKRHMVYDTEGLRDFSDTLPLPGIEWKLTVDRARAAMMGADVTKVGAVVQFVTNGLKVGEFRPDDAEDAVDIRIRFPERDRGLEALDDLRITTNQGLIPISSFVTREPIPNVDIIERFNGTPVHYLRADVEPGVLADDKVKELQAWIAEQNFDPLVDISFRGANEEQEEAGAFLVVASFLALLLMFILLVTQFNSFYQSGLILFAIVMSTAGVLLGLLITNDPFSMLLTGTAIVALAGIVVNNNIVLIDTYNHLRRDHPDLDYLEIIVRTGAQRLRPVMLTTFTTVLGILPMACFFSIDLINREIVYGSPVATFWLYMARSLISGLTFATLLTLIATPAMLALPYQIDMVWQWIRARLPWKQHQSASVTASAIPVLHEPVQE